MNIVLKAELQKISGAKQRRRIIPWLKEIGVPFIKDADGWPVVAESALNAKLGEPTKNEPRINFA
jgi:hypothetical protein